MVPYYKLYYFFVFVHLAGAVFGIAEMLSPLTGACFKTFMLAFYYTFAMAYHLIIIYTLQMTRDFKFIKQDCQTYYTTQGQ